MIINKYKIKYSEITNIHGGYRIQDLFKKTIFDENEIYKFQKLTDINDINDLYRLVYRIDKLMNYYNLDYCADFGTALGITRHKGIMLWDDDVDISIPSETEKFLKKLKKKIFLNLD